MAVEHQITGGNSNPPTQNTDVNPQSGAIAVGATSPTAALNREAHDFVGIETDANITGTAITFKVGNDPTTLPTKLVKKDDGTAYTITVGVSGAYRVDPSYFSGWRFILPVSGTTQATNPSTITGLFRSFRSGT